MQILMLLARFEHHKYGIIDIFTSMKTCSLRMELNSRLSI